MTEATKKSVGKFTNCGCYCDLPWIYTLAHSESFSRLPPQQVYTLISALEESIREGIITGEQVKKEFTQLKARVAESQITRHVDETSRLPVVGTGIDRAMDNLETSSNWT
ncbi:hypothetical protein PHLCEN_2v4409 [Hermanssonia centrifuga]|uniref:Uncharacterized protein n=1 Tax=Hermanssonia centrifuga TaxID=98765 RepID=A0A2R6PNP2_9APHY|nr:hypothetical protein PHLCEN_2v4409 [Hermanssonia centrifuga]